LTKLQDLKLFQNKLTDLPDDITKLTNLNVLIVDNIKQNSNIKNLNLKFLKLQNEYNFHHKIKFMEDEDFKTWNYESDVGWEVWHKENINWINWLKNPTNEVNIDKIKKYKYDIESQIFFYPQLLLFFIYKENSLLKYLKSPVTTLKVIFDKLRLFLMKLCKYQNKSILKCLILLWIELRNACLQHSLEVELLTEYMSEIENLTKRLFRCSSLDNENLLQCFILNEKYWGNIQKSVGYGFSSTSGSYQRIAYIFENDSVINLALKHQCKFFFSISQIRRTISRLYLDYPKRDMLVM
jgi:hypothetical protein